MITIIVVGVHQGLKGLLRVWGPAFTRRCWPAGSDVSIFAGFYKGVMRLL